MPLTYPLAETARAALQAASTARTVGEARDKAGASVSLVSEWLRPSAAERETLQHQIDAGVTAGFIQVYEDNQGQPVFAVAFWKRGAAPPAPPLPRREPPPEASAAPPAPGDSVDDLYFERARSSRRASRGRKGRPGDPNQMDLFAGPDQKGFETPDDGNPLVVIVEEEGSGSTFGVEAIRGSPQVEAGQGVPEKSPKVRSGRKPKADSKP
jgi:hypothetical protein